MSGSIAKQIQNELTPPEGIGSDGIDRRGFLEVHGLGRHRPRLDLCRRCTDLTRVRRANETVRAVRFHLRADQR